MSRAGELSPARFFMQFPCKVMMEGLRSQRLRRKEWRAMVQGRSKPCPYYTRACQSDPWYSRGDPCGRSGFYFV
ncbi:MAG: hypothetical protein ACJ788_24580 [Ktedonobacteraceae bacterium]